MYLSTRKHLENIWSLNSKIWESKQLHLRDAEISKAEDWLMHKLAMMLNNIKPLPLKPMESKLKRGAENVCYMFTHTMAHNF